MTDIERKETNLEQQRNEKKLKREGEREERERKRYNMKMTKLRLTHCDKIHKPVKLIVQLYITSPAIWAKPASWSGQNMIRKVAKATIKHSIQNVIFRFNGIEINAT